MFSRIIRKFMRDYLARKFSQERVTACYARMDGSVRQRRWCTDRMKALSECVFAAFPTPVQFTSRSLFRALYYAASGHRQAGRRARLGERDTGAARAINPRDRSGPGPTEPAITQTVHDLVGAASKLSHDRQTDTGRQSECDGDRTFAPIPNTCPQQSTIAGIRLREDNGSVGRGSN